MRITAAQTTALYEQPYQMGIPHAIVIHLQEEGIESVSNLGGFDKDAFDQIAANLCRPTGRIPDPNPTAVAESTIPTPPFLFGAKSQNE